MSDYTSQFSGQEIDARLAKVPQLETAVAGKQATLVSGSNIKTINGQPVLGSGNLQIQTGETDVVKYTAQTLTEEQKAQARANIDAASLEDINSMDFVTATTLPTASASTMGHIYLIGPDANNNYDRYFTQESDGAYSWVSLGSTQINLSTYATKAEVTQLEAKANDSVYLNIARPSQDYDARVSYISNEDNLGAYINTGVVPNANLRVVIAVEDFQHTSTMLLGSRVARDSSCFLIGSHSEGTIRFDYATNTQSSGGVNSQFTYTGGLGNRTLEIDKTNCKVDGVVVHTFPVNGFNTTYPIHIFGMNNAGEHVDMLKSVKVLWVKIYDNGTLIKDFFPVRVGTTGYLYDSVSETLFGNSGSGIFAYGDDIPIGVDPNSSQRLHDVTGVPFNPITNFESVLDDSGEGLDSYYLAKKQFKNKIWVGLGDSLTYQDSSRYPGLSWSPMVESEIGLVFKNCGVGNTCLAGSEVDAFWKRLSSVESFNPDILTILGGANDLYRDIPIGTDAEYEKTIANKDCNTFKGAYSYIIETLLTWKPALRIVLLTTAYARTDGAEHTPGIGLTYKDYANATLSVAEYYGLPVVDLYRNMGINKLTQGDTYCRADHIHWNARACQIVASLVISKFVEINNADPIE